MTDAYWAGFWAAAGAMVGVMAVLGITAISCLAVVWWMTRKK